MSEQREDPFAHPATGRPTPWSVVHNGIEYRGEVVVADAWRPELGELGPGDTHFRIVVLTEHGPAPDIADGRIACCVPGEGGGRAVREERATYGASGVGAGHAARGGEARRYAAGTVYTAAGPALDAAAVFSEEDSGERVAGIASALLAAAYDAALPIDTSSLKRALTPVEVARVFEGFFGPEADAEARDALKAFAAALGLARRRSPARLAPEGCPVFPLIERELDEGGGTVPVASLYSALSARYGLTWPLITLYLLCYVYHSGPSVELALRPDAGLRLRSGETPPLGRLTADLVPRVCFSDGLAQAFDCLCRSEETPGEALLPYLRVLVTGPAEAAAAPGGPLWERLAAIGQEVADIEGHVEALAPRLGGAPAAVSAMLGRLGRIARCPDLPTLRDAVQAEYDAPGSLADDVSLCQRLAGLGDIAGEVLAAASFLDEAHLREGDGELAMDRRSLEAQLALESLLPNLHLWPGLKSQVEWFEARYRAAYAAHHQGYHREMATLHHVLEDCAPEVAALDLVNTLEELGPPVGRELVEQHRWLLARVVPCPVAEGGDASLDEGPRCPRCQVSLTDEPPRGDVERFTRGLKQALREQQRRLSSEAVRQILAESGERRIDQFIKVVQTSDLSALVNTIDEELVEFVRSLLGEVHVDVEWRLVFSELCERFPYMVEDEVDTASTEFTWALREAFSRARRENPGKRIRLRLR